MTALTNKNIEIRECGTLEELAACVDLQREVFALPETEISPVRHFVVTRNAGGFTLGAFLDGELIGFVLSIPAFLRGERAFYSHMTGVKSEFQGSGVGARLKWAQRERALKEGVEYIKWTFEPWKARNAFFNIEKLGVWIREYEENFYGTDYTTAAQQNRKIGLASDRLFAEWELSSDKVRCLAAGERFSEPGEVFKTVSIPVDWFRLFDLDPQAAVREQKRIRGEFHEAFAAGMVVRSFDRSASEPIYLFYKD